MTQADRYLDELVMLRHERDRLAEVYAEKAHALAQAQAAAQEARRRFEQLSAAVESVSRRLAESRQQAEWTALAKITGSRRVA